MAVIASVAVGAVIGSGVASAGTWWWGPRIVGSAFIRAATDSLRASFPGCECSIGSIDIRVRGRIIVRNVVVYNPVVEGVAWEKAELFTIDTVNIKLRVRKFVRSRGYVVDVAALTLTGLNVFFERPEGNDDPSVLGGLDSNLYRVFQTEPQVVDESCETRTNDTQSRDFKVREYTFGTVSVAGSRLEMLGPLSRRLKSSARTVLIPDFVIEDLASHTEFSSTVTLLHFLAMFVGKNILHRATGIDEYEFGDLSRMALHTARLVMFEVGDSASRLDPFRWGSRMVGAAFLHAATDSLRSSFPGCECSIGSMEMGLRGRIIVRDVVVKNPVVQGVTWEKAELFTIDQVDVQLRVSKLVRSYGLTVEATSLTITGLHVFFERPEGEDNNSVITGLDSNLYRVLMADPPPECDGTAVPAPTERHLTDHGDEAGTNVSDTNSEEDKVREYVFRTVTMVGTRLELTGPLSRKWANGSEIIVLPNIVVDDVAEETTFSSFVTLLQYVSKVVAKNMLYQLSGVDEYHFGDLSRNLLEKLETLSKLALSNVTSLVASG